MSKQMLHPERLKAWLDQLENLPLPVPLEQRDDIRRALNDSRRSIRDIADLLQDAPTLAFAILREANRAQSARDNPAESLEVALNRLGLSRASQLLDSLPAVPQAQMPRALSQLLLISRHAMQQASGLFANRLARLWQEIHWGSLFTLAPLWALATARPELMENWQRQVYGLGRCSSEVEEELLGTRLLPLCRALADSWRLPDWVGQGYALLSDDKRLLVRALHVAHTEHDALGQQQRLDADPELQRWLTRPANTILLANSIAMAAHQSWGGVHMLRWQRLTSLYLQMQLQELQQTVHGLAAQSARRHARPQLWHPAEALLWPWEARRWLNGPKAEEPAKAPDTLAQWRQHCTRLMQTPSPFGNAVQLLDCASDALQACGLQRGMILLADKGGSWLQARRDFGLDGEVGDFKLEVAASPVLRKLLQQPGQLRLSPTNMAEFSALIPGALKALIPSEHLLLRSLGNGARVVMLVVCDRNGQPLADLHAQAFGRTVQCIEHAVKQMARGT